jgi:hypothetical protein
MVTHDFVTMSETATVGDAFRALAAAKANMGWHVIVQYADHYGGMRAGKLARAVISRGVQPALQATLRELPVPVADTVLANQAGNLNQVRKLTVVLENNQPATVAFEGMGSIDLEAKAAFDQLVSAVATAPASTTNFIIAAETDTIRQVVIKLDDAKGNEAWYVIVRFADSYGAIQAGKLTQMGLDAHLRDLDIAIINTVQSETLAADQIHQPTLALKGDLPALIYQPARPDSISARQDWQRLITATRTRSAQGKPPVVAPPTAQPAETTDERARYVNTWFTDRIDGQAFNPEHSLAHTRKYFVQLHIGPLLRESIIVAPRPIDPDLPPIPDKGLRLRVKLFSRDFDIENDSAELRLFRTGATERLHFAVTPRAATRDACLRAGIYYQNNLVQSIMLHAQVDEQEMKLGRGRRATWAEVEYSLSEDWADIMQLQPRRLSIFVNDSPDGTHMVGIMGTQAEGKLDIGRDKMKEAITEFRSKLLGIIMDDQKRYRYSADNSGDPAKFVEDLKTLAYLGTNLYQAVFFQDNTLDLMDKISGTLSGPEPAVIQVARLSPDFVYPWAGIYDRPLLIDRGKNQVCLKALDSKTPEAAIQACGACAHGDDPNTICLSCFWGFRHILEQPVGTTEGGKPSSIVREIKSAGKPTATMNVYVGDDFKLGAQHQNWVTAQIKNKGGELISSDELVEVQAGLRQPQQLCYFYCHGGASPESVNPWLTVGKDERLMPPDLFGLSLHKYWRAKDVRPLVFINACHSIEFTPEALSSFLQRFATSGASGIIGTEISVFEPLAVEFGQGLIQAFLNGEPIGQVVQRLRWQLLLKRNVLGLVYTPYCYADLHLAA